MPRQKKLFVQKVSPLFTDLFTIYCPSQYFSLFSNRRPKSKTFPFFTNLHFQFSGLPQKLMMWNNDWVQTEFLPFASLNQQWKRSWSVYKKLYFFTRNCNYFFFFIFLLMSEQRRRSSNWCCNWMKCSCGWSVLSSASQPQRGSDRRGMMPADFMW